MFREVKEQIQKTSRDPSVQENGVLGKLLRKEEGEMVVMLTQSERRDGK